MLFFRRYWAQVHYRLLLSAHWRGLHHWGLWYLVVWKFWVFNLRRVFHRRVFVSRSPYFGRHNHMLGNVGMHHAWSINLIRRLCSVKGLVKAHTKQGLIVVETYWLRHIWHESLVVRTGKFILAHAKVRYILGLIPPVHLALNVVGELIARENLLGALALALVYHLRHWW